MSNDHRVDESDMASKPSRSNMRASVQDMHGKENQAKFLLGNSEAAENQYATMASVKKNPPKASRENSAVIFATILWLFMVIRFLGEAIVFGPTTSTVWERRK
jgi:hypothetical protein